MANHGYMTITGKTQGLISAGCSTQDSIGNKCQTGHTDEIMVLSYTHNMVNIGNINKPTHSPIIITKNVDKASPLLAQALSERAYCYSLPRYHVDPPRCWHQRI